MKTLTAIAALLSAAVAISHQPDSSSTRGDIVWETSMQDAKARAVREGKGIFALHMFGKLDDALC